MYNEYKDCINDLKNSPEHSPEHNEYLCMEYPFLIPRNRWTGKIVDDYNFEYTELDNIEEGWRTLGLNLCEEIKQELLKYEDGLEKYRILEIKEKYGSLRWYDNGCPTGSRVHEIIKKYEDMSSTICSVCGAKATKYTTGWIYPICDECDKLRKEKIFNVK